MSFVTRQPMRFEIIAKRATQISASASPSPTDRVTYMCLPQRVAVESPPALICRGRRQKDPSVRLISRLQILDPGWDAHRGCHERIGAMSKNNNLPPGSKAPASGQYGIVGPRGGKTGSERTVTRGEPLPPTPKQGQGYTLVDPTKNGDGSGRSKK